MATPFHLPGPFGVLTDDQALPYLVGSEPYSPADTKVDPIMTKAERPIEFRQCGSIRSICFARTRADGLL